MKNIAEEILIENAFTFKERNEVRAVLESSPAQLEGAMVAKLYRSAVEKSYVDFDDIPASKGDISKYNGLASMRESLAIVEDLGKKGNVYVPEAKTVYETLRHIETNRDFFIKGFLLENTLVMMIYNTMVASCVETTSLIISSYVEFARNPQTVEFKIINRQERPSRITLDALEEFNKQASSGKLTMLLKSETEQRKDNFTGSSAIIIGTGIIVVALAIIPIIRELIFGFYYSRIQISEYLDHQQELIKVNRSMIEASSLPAKEKRAVLAKQQKQADQLMRISDKIRVETPKTQAKVKSEMKQESKNWTLGAIQSEFAKADSNGFGLL